MTTIAWEKGAKNVRAISLINLMTPIWMGGNQFERFLWCFCGRWKVSHLNWSNWPGFKAAITVSIHESVQIESTLRENAQNRWAVECLLYEERDRMLVNYIIYLGKAPVASFGTLYLINWIIIVLISAFQFNRLHTYLFWCYLFNVKLFCIYSYGTQWFKFDLSIG